MSKYTTAWGTTVDDWYPAFLAAHADLARQGGGRLIVPAGQYHISGHVVFDVPAVSVHLNKDSHLELVGDPDVFYGAPIGFYGNAKPGEPIENRIQRDFAALLGPGSVGYPANQLHRYPHENGAAMSYIKTAVIDGIHVPHVPGKGITAQFGCNHIVMRNCTIGNTFTGDVERNYSGQASLVAQGGWSFDRRPPESPLFTDVVIENNSIEGETVRGIHASFCNDVRVIGNKLAPSWGAGLLVKAAHSAIVSENLFQRPCQGFPSTTGSPYAEYVSQPGIPEDAMFFISVKDSTLKSNILEGHSHRHGVFAGEAKPVYQLPAGVIYARKNKLSRGTDTIFGGIPEWDTD